MASIKGGCLCGQVTYACSEPPLVAGHCQCVDCRKSSGTGHSSHMAVPRAAVVIQGMLKTYSRKADSGNLVTRAFCPECGSPMCSTNEAMPDLLFLRASSLEDTGVFQPQMVVYTSRGAAWDLIDPQLPRFDTMPPAGP